VNVSFRAEIEKSWATLATRTVIEYHYKVVSDYSVHIENWMMQEELPVVYNQYELACIKLFSSKTSIY